jgi:hypothetical protein
LRVVTLGKVTIALGGYEFLEYLIDANYLDFEAGSYGRTANQWTGGVLCCCGIDCRGGRPAVLAMLQPGGE